jgi:hypothetical protein
MYGLLVFPILFHPDPLIPNPELWIRIQEANLLWIQIQGANLLRIWIRILPGHSCCGHWKKVGFVVKYVH